MPDVNPSIFVGLYIARGLRSAVNDSSGSARWWCVFFFFVLCRNSVSQNLFAVVFFIVPGARAFGFACRDVLLSAGTLFLRLCVPGLIFEVPGLPFLRLCRDLFLKFLRLACRDFVPLRAGTYFLFPKIYIYRHWPYVYCVLRSCSLSTDALIRVRVAPPIYFLL